MFELFNLLLSILTMGANATNKVVSAFLKMKKEKNLSKVIERNGNEFPTQNNKR